MQHLLHKYYFIIGWVLLFSLSACNTSKYLKEDEFLLKKNSVKLITESPIKNKSTLAYELTRFYQQKPNTNFLFLFPREWFYYATQDSSDNTKFDRWQRRVISEVPTIYSSVLADSTARSMEYYLQYNGYYNARVVPDDRIRGKKASVTYVAYPRRQYTVDSVFLSSDDPSIDSILQATQAQSGFKRGVPLTRTLYEQERERITRYLRNNGYAYFYPNYVAPLEVDTTLKSNQANVYFEVLTPPADSSHQVYRVGNITVYPQYDPTQDEGELQDSIVEDFIFKITADTFLVKPQVLIDAIYLKKGDLYSQENYDKTVRQLTALGVYKYVRIQEKADSVNENDLNFSIELPRNPKIEIGVDFEVNYTNRSTASGTGNLIGLTGRPTVRNRNLFKGAELLVANLSAGVEVNPRLFDTVAFWNTIDFRAQADLYLPRFIDYFKLWRGLNGARIGKKTGLVTDAFYQSLSETATTRISASYNYLLLLGFYSYDLLNASFGYDLQQSATTRYIVNHIGIDYLNPQNEPAFDNILSLNPFLQRSFGKQLFVSLLFRDLSFAHTSRPNRAGVSNYFGLNVELSGTEVWAGNAIYNAFAIDSDTLQLGNIDFSQYAKVETDLRLYKTFTPKNSFAARINFGIARPFGYTTDVPYVKQFYVGGPNSIRGWVVRELGPGGYIDSLTVGRNERSRNRLLFYQTGDLKLEFNAEYRFPIFSRLNGAIFLDGGNIWSIQQDTSRLGSQFRLTARRFENTEVKYPVNDPFYKQIALSTGFGIRLDLTYFIFRLDGGVKLRSPYPLDTQGDTVQASDYWYGFRKWGIRDVNFNLGLGYPF